MFYGTFIEESDFCPRMMFGNFFHESCKPILFVFLPQHYMDVIHHNIIKMKAIYRLPFFLAIVVVFFCVRVMAQQPIVTPIAGNSLVNDYIAQHLVYSQADLEQNNSGKVVVGFHLDVAGNSSGHHVVSSFSEAASPVALDMVKKILWEPALRQGRIVDADCEYEVTFSAKSYRRYWKRHERVAIPLTLESDTSYRIFQVRELEEVATPYFADGRNFGQYIAEELHFPEAARASEVQGVVRLHFVIETDGSVSNITIKKSVGAGCDNEAIRLMQNTHWIPAVKNGKYVRSHYQQDITFQIGNRNYQDGNSY